MKSIFSTIESEIDNEALTIEKSAASLENFKYALFTAQLKSWEPNSLHWAAPSNFIMYSDGTWFLYAQHCANFRRLGGLVDSGASYSWYLNMTYFNQSGGVGDIVHARDYLLTTLSYKQEKDNVTASGFDNAFLSLSPSIESAIVSRAFR